MGLKLSRLRTRVGAALFGLLVGVLATPHAQDDVRRGATTGITGLSGCGASTTVVLGNATCSGTPTLTSATISTTALATTTTDGVVLQNTTVSTSGVPVQYAPRVRFTGHAWNTTATAADNYLEMIEELRPASSATPTSSLVFAFRRSTDGSTGSFTDALTLTSSGAATFANSVTLTAGSLQVAGTANFDWATRFHMATPADAQLTLTNDGRTIGVGLDVGTDGVLAVKTRAQADTAILAVNQLKTTAALITATGASTPTFLTNGVGGTGGPTTQAQNGWMKMLDSTGATVWIPVWK